MFNSYGRSASLLGILLLVCIIQLARNHFQLNVALMNGWFLLKMKDGKQIKTLASIVVMISL